MSPPSPAPPDGASSRKATVATALMVLVCVVLGLGFAARVGQTLYDRLRPSPDVVIPPTIVKVIELEPGPFEHTVPIAGTLAPVHSVDVFPKLGGKVVRMHAGLGERVEKGDALATVESVEYGLQARQAEVGLEMAEEAVGVAQRSFERLDRVREQTGSLGLSDQAFEEASLQVETAVTHRDLAGLQRDLAHQMVRNATMVAPVSGVVAKVYATLGSMVGNEYPAFHIDTTDELIVRCEVGDRDLPHVATSQAVRLWADVLPDRIITGTVTGVAPTLDAWTRRAPVEISVPNPDGGITGNLFARGEIVVATVTDALVLPQQVVHRTVDGAWVQVARDGVVAVVEVQVLAESHEHLSVSGLQPGALVIVPGAEHLAEGEPVEAAGTGGPVADVAQ
jgi:RND family efflux transporter MFP subunit